MPGANCLDAARDEVEAEVTDDDGSMTRRPDLVRFAAAHDLVTVAVADIVRYRRRTESLVCGHEGRGIAPDPDDISNLTTTRTRMDHQLGGGFPADGPPMAPVATVEEVS